MVDLEENRRELQNLKEKFDSLEKALGTEEELAKILKELENKTMEEGFWNDTKAANLVLRDMKEVKAKYTSLTQVKQNLEELIELNDFLMIEHDDEMEQDLAKSTSSLEKEIEKLETKMFLSGKFDRNHAIITLHPGAGGTESQDWAQMLYRMYSRWALNNGYHVKEIDLQDRR